MHCKVRKHLFLLRVLSQISACTVTQCLILSQFMKTFIATMIFIAQHSAFAIGAFDESRLEVDPNMKISMEDLFRKHQGGKNPPSITANGKTYTVDYSAVVEADPRKLQVVAQSYSNYVKWGVPNLERAAIIPNAGDYLKTITYDKDGIMTGYNDKDQFVLWNKLSISVLGLSFTSQQYYKVLLRKNVSTSGDYGAVWFQHPDMGWGYAEDTEIENQKGSWYVQPVTWSGSTTPKTYIRYFLQADITNPFAGAVEGEIKKSFKKGAVELFKVLVDQSTKH